MLLLNFFEHVGTDAAEGALVILGQLVALVDVVADGAAELFHGVTVLSNLGWICLMAVLYFIKLKL